MIIGSTSIMMQMTTYHPRIVGSANAPSTVSIVRQPTSSFEHLAGSSVAPIHLLYPGGEHERLWLEEVVHVTKDGGRPLFSWGFAPLTGR
jgi:hypothetical protein